VEDEAAEGLPRLVEGPEDGGGELEDARFEVIIALDLDRVWINSEVRDVALRRDVILKKRPLTPRPLSQYILTSSVFLQPNISSSCPLHPVSRSRKHSPRRSRPRTPTRATLELWFSLSKVVSTAHFASGSTTRTQGSVFAPNHTTDAPQNPSPILLPSTPSRPTRMTSHC
jgi:hypothetical protein